MKKIQSVNIRSYFENYALYIIMSLIIVVIGLMSPRFFSFRVLRDILIQSSTRVIVAMGCMFIIVSGSADLSGGRNLNFNLNLIHFDPQVIDYVLIHELAHLVYLNHSAKFWALVGKLCRSEERRVGKECRSRWSPYH